MDWSTTESKGVFFVAQRFERNLHTGLTSRWLLATRRVANRETFVRQAGVMNATALGRHYLLLLSQRHDVPLCVFLTRAAERVRSRLRGTLVIATIVSRKRRSANA